MADSPAILMVHGRSSWGGNTAMVLALSRALLSRGYKVELAAPPQQPYIPHFTQAGITVHSIGLWGKKDLRAPFSLAVLVRKGGFDLLHSHTRPADLAAYFAAKLSARPLVITQHGNVNLDRQTLIRRHDLYAWVYNMVLRGSKRVVAVCQATSEELKCYCGVKPERIRVVYNGIEPLPAPDAENRRLTRLKLGIAENSVVGIILGAIHWKGHEILAESLAKLKGDCPELMVLVAGSGPREVELKAQISKLGLSDRMLMLGFRPDAATLLGACDFFVLPSRSEAFPVSILEAMSLGLPVIASRVGGIPEAVEDGVNGLLVDSGDVSALAVALRKMVKDEKMRNLMGQKGRIRAEKFSLANMVDGYLKIYEELGCKI